MLSQTKEIVEPKKTYEELRPGRHYSSGPLQSTQTDDKGRFTFQHIHQGAVQLFLAQGNMFKYWTYLADGSPEEARLTLPERRPELDAGPALVPAPPPRPVEPGQIAPEWQVGSWSDGRDRKLANERGKVIVLYCWGITFWQSVSALPALGKLAAEFEPRGVEFLAKNARSVDPQVPERASGGSRTARGRRSLPLAETRRVGQPRKVSTGKNAYLPWQEKLGNGSKTIQVA